MKLNDLDKELIGLATELVKSNSDIYSNISMHVGCVIKAKSGKIYKPLLSAHRQKRVQIFLAHLRRKGGKGRQRRRSKVSAEKSNSYSRAAIRRIKRGRRQLRARFGKKRFSFHN